MYFALSRSVKVFAYSTKKKRLAKEDLYSFCLNFNIYPKAYIRDVTYLRIK